MFRTLELGIHTSSSTTTSKAPPQWMCYCSPPTPHLWNNHSPIFFDWSVTLCYPSLYGVSPTHLPLWHLLGHPLSSSGIVNCYIHRATIGWAIKCTESSSCPDKERIGGKGNKVHYFSSLASTCNYKSLDLRSGSNFLKKKYVKLKLSSNLNRCCCKESLTTTFMSWGLKPILDFSKVSTSIWFSSWKFSDLSFSSEWWFNVQPECWSKVADEKN